MGVCNDWLKLNGHSPRVEIVYRLVLLSRIQPNLGIVFVLKLIINRFARIWVLGKAVL